MMWVCVVFVCVLVFVVVVCVVVGMSTLVAIVAVAWVTAMQVSVVLYSTLSWNLQVIQKQHLNISGKKSTLVIWVVWMCLFVFVAMWGVESSLNHIIKPSEPFCHLAGCSKRRRILLEDLSLNGHWQVPNKPIQHFFISYSVYFSACALKYVNITRHSTLLPQVGQLVACSMSEVSWSKVRTQFMF